jgi:hypothetical protein
LGHETQAPNGLSRQGPPNLRPPWTRRAAVTDDSRSPPHTLAPLVRLPPRPRRDTDKVAGHGRLRDQLVIIRTRTGRGQQQRARRLFRPPPSVTQALALTIASDSTIGGSDSALGVVRGRGRCSQPRSLLMDLLAVFRCSPLVASVSRLAQEPSSDGTSGDSAVYRCLPLLAVGFILLWDQSGK